YGSPFALGYGVQWYPASPRLLQLLFSSEHGLWTWTPMLFLASVGLVPLIRRQPAVGWRCTLTALLFWYVIASYQDWHGLSSYSNRFLISLTPVFVVSLAALFNAVEETIPAWPGVSLPAAAVLLLALWNAGLIFQWGTELVPKRGAISWPGTIKNQFTVVPSRLLRYAGRLFRDRSALVHEVQVRDLPEAADFRGKR